MKRQKLVSILVFGYILCCITKTFGQDCSQILQHGIYNYTSTDFQNERLQSLINWYKSENIQTYENAKSSSFNATIPIDGVLVGLGFSQDENGFQHLKNYLETYSSQTLEEKTKFAQVIQQIEPEIIKAWNNCVQTMSQGNVLLWIEYTSDPNVFNLCAKYNAVAGGATVGDLNFDFDATRIKVNSNIFLKRNLTLNRTKPITSAVLRQAFTVKGKDDFVINISGMGSGLTYSFKPHLIEPPANEYNINSLAIKGTLVNSEARTSGSLLANTKDKNVYLHLTGTIKITPTASSNASRFRVTALDKHSPDPDKPIIISFTPRWVIYDNLSQETTYPIDLLLSFPKGKEYFFEVYFDQADGVRMTSTLNYSY